VHAHGLLNLCVRRIGSVLNALINLFADDGLRLLVDVRKRRLSEARLGELVPGLAGDAAQIFDLLQHVSEANHVRRGEVV
jgi:hypothetical protein